ncbi:MAG: hypothetical protein IJN97_03575, partial [Oscillospiraceae bacterium]|nr:hypothetical protein [Oscillospiraceae bacterium]
MKLYIKQQVFSLTAKFTVKDERGEDKYFVEGDFLSLHARMHIYNTMRQEIAQIYRKITFLPRFVL